jgi:hypothetical protein
VRRANRLAAGGTFDPGNGRIGKCRPREAVSKLDFPQFCALPHVDYTKKQALFLQLRDNLETSPA